MSQDNLSIAENYYKALGEKDTHLAEKFLHPKVQCIGPLTKIMGKENVSEANKKFISLFTTLKVRSSFASRDQAMIVYDLLCPLPVDAFSAVALLTLKDNLISQIELFYDPRPFEAKK